MTTLSFTGRRWIDPSSDDALVGQAARELALPPLVARCLVRRAPQAERRSWLRPSLEALHDPHLMLGMDAAVARVQRAVAAQERVRIVTDYDVDGTTSSLILQSVMRLLGLRDDRLDYHIPNRMGEGYGFSMVAADRAVQDGVGLLITADIGVRDHQAVAKAKAGGVDVIICDHHLPPGSSVPPDAAVVLCPPQAGCTYPNRALAACGVSLKLAQALLASHPKRDVVIQSMLKVAAIGTVADVVDLATPENRAIVALGLDALNRGGHAPGLQAMLEVAGLTIGDIQAEDLGFRIGPRINAAGRLDDARAVVDLFNERDLGRARGMAARLDSLNRERQAIQESLFEAALAAIPDPLPDFVVVGGKEEEGWHRGVVGIVASKVRERVHRPVAVVSISGDDARGSIRSVEGVHAVRALDTVADLLQQYGGHPVAAGFSMAARHLDTLRERLGEFVRAQGTSEGLAPVVELDGVCTPDDLGWHVVDALRQLAPHGKGNPAPLLRVRADNAGGAALLGDRHLKFKVGPWEAIWWGGAEHRAKLNVPFEVAATPGIHRWNGRTTLRLTVEDARATDDQKP